MGLSRLENFLKSARGTILYVDPNSLDSTDSIENSGNSLTRPFKTIQRALIEAARFSYQRGLNNDRFNKTTILLYPGDHIVDNRPGYIPTGAGTYSARSGLTGLTDITQWDIDTRFDLTNPDNPLYKLNSIHGGVIVPRGTSIVGMDLRKTKIRPLYVPDPENDNIERSAILRTTGACYFWQFTILDADPNGNCYKDYTSSQFVPNFSHHKLTGFEYADGVNGVYINDDFLNDSVGSKVDTTRTDLDMYYEKIAAVYGDSSGRGISPDYGSGTLDIQPLIDEYRIVGPKGASVGITSIRAGDGVIPTTTITVDLVNTIEGLSVDSPIQVSGISAEGYDGQYVINTVPSSTQITYKTQNAPANPLPGVTGSTLSLSVDTVTSASPYIFNISVRSVYGMCGLLADGDKATGFKSMVVAQYTGIGLQKDENAFVRYDSGTGKYVDSTKLSNLNTNSRSRFKPEYENFHIKATNDSFLQLVSVFAIGYAQHFATENGGDIALNNSNSNFGAKALEATGFKREAFTADDYGYITHIIPPKEIESTEISVEFGAIDVGVTTSKSAGAGTTTRLYLYNETNQNVPPKVLIDGYHIGAKQNDELNIQSFVGGALTSYSSRIVMPYGPYNSTQSSSEKLFTVERSTAGINSITLNTLKLTEVHSFANGESIRIIADDGHLPDGLESNQIYYAITKESASGIGTDEIRIAKTLSDAINGSTTATAITLNNKGGTLSIVSRVSDKNPGEIGHPVQFDNQWYINVDVTNNQIYDVINSSGVSGLGNATTRSYVTRKPDSRSLIDTLYRVRYVLPKNSSTTAKPPTDGFILQESNNIIGTGTTEIAQLYNSSGAISNSTLLRNPKFIADASYSSGTVTIRAEIPHNLRVGEEVEIVNVSPAGYNGTYTVTSILSAKEFTYTTTLSLGSFANDTSSRTSSLPYFRRKKYEKTYQVYRSQVIQPYITNVQDGVYYLTLINYSNNPTVAPFNNLAFAQPVENLYPQLNNDNPNSDPDSTTSHALPDIIGKVVVNDLQKSITKETLESFIVGYGITNIQSSSGTAHTIYTSLDHGLSGITTVSIISGGSNYGSSAPFTGNLYNARLVGFAGSTTGSNATARIAVTAGAITGVQIIDGGSAYGIGNTLTVVGVATTAGHVIGVVKVESISNNIGDTLSISGVSSALNSGYNTIYRVSEITTGRPKEINVISGGTISNFSAVGLGSTVTSSSGYLFTDKSVGVSTFVYNSVTGLATVGFTTSHGFRVDNKIVIRGANQSAFNGDFIVKKLYSSVGNSLVDINIGIGATTSTLATGTLHAYRPTLTSYGGDLDRDTENTSGRLDYQYAGITTTLGTSILATDPDSTTLNVPNAVALGLNLGDYLLIDNEIFRIKQAVTSNSLQIFRSILGSPRETHIEGALVRRIKVTPVELRRNSIIRASGHTFEYLGFGPGNYSTSLPDKQDRSLSRSEIFLAQSTKTNGGLVVYTGMNSDGDFFTGNKKINSATGKEETYDTPVPTNTGEKNSSEIVDITDTQKVFVGNSIKVEGGRDKNIVSEFNGPVVFNNKVTTNADVEANSIYLQGEEDISRRLSVSDAKPTIVGNYGDVEFNSIPRTNGNAGWIYTTNNEWKAFGWINDSLYGVGISTNNGPVGFSTLLNLVGVGLTISKDYDSATGITTVYFEGDPYNTIGISSEGSFIGDANALNFVGSKDGFGFDITVDFNSAVGLATVRLDAPVDIIDFKISGDGNLGYAAPSFGTTSIGTRIIYENAIGLSTDAHTNYAVGVGANDSLWWSVPQNNSYGFNWYAGETEIANLLSNGVFTVLGETSLINAKRFNSTIVTGTAPISVASSTVVSNLNVNYLEGFVSAATTSPDTIVRRDSSNNINGNVSHLIHNISGAQRGEWYADIPARQGYSSFNRAGDISSGICTFTQVSDIYKNQSTVGTALTCDFTTGPITRTTSTNTTLININNVPTTDSRALNYTVVLNAATTVSNLSSIQFQINGTALNTGGNSIRWLNNLPPTGTAAGYYFFGFSIFRIGSVWEVLGTFATYA
jgi:hypothetical protein